MNNTIALSQNFVLIFGAMTVVLGFLILYAITLVVKLTKMTSENQCQAREEQSAAGYCENADVKQMPAGLIDDEDDEEKLVAVLAASAKVAEEYPNSHYRITKITRIR